MKTQTKQFDTFDNLEDRRELFILFERLGAGLPEEMQRKVRARFIESLIPASENGFDGRPLKATPCSANEAFMMFVHVCGCLGVPIRQAAEKLTEWVKKRAWLHYRESVLSFSDGNFELIA